MILDDQPSAAPVVVISDRFWRKEFGAGADAIGRTITINKKISFTVIGVTLPEFFGETIGNIPDFWIPINAAPTQVESLVASQFIAPLARLRHDVSREKAQAGLNVICSQWLNHKQASIRREGFSCRTLPTRSWKKQAERLLAAVMVADGDCRIRHNSLPAAIWPARLWRALPHGPMKSACEWP